MTELSTRSEFTGKNELCRSFLQEKKTFLPEGKENYIVSFSSVSN